MIRKNNSNIALLNAIQMVLFKACRIFVRNLDLIRLK